MPISTAPQTIGPVANCTRRNCSSLIIGSLYSASTARSVLTGTDNIHATSGILLERCGRKRGSSVSAVALAHRQRQNEGTNPLASKAVEGCVRPEIVAARHHLDPVVLRCQL